MYLEHWILNDRKERKRIQAIFTYLNEINYMNDLALEPFLVIEKEVRFCTRVSRVESV
ncbi:18969_t:CDS:2 [Rhizophagus irregularis]|nr:18969_t:CDS:2 [Rhizophagus irregularis]